MVTVHIHPDIKERLKELKLCDRDSYNDVISRLVNGNEALDKAIDEGLRIEDTPKDTKPKDFSKQPQEFKAKDFSKEVQDFPIEDFTQPEY